MLDSSQNSVGGGPLSSGYSEFWKNVSQPDLGDFENKQFLSGYQWVFFISILHV